MTVLEKNLAALEARFPGLGAELRSSPVPEDLPEFFLSRSGAVTARWKGSTLASTFDPQAEAQRFLPEVDSEVDFAVVGGFGLGYVPLALLERYPDLPVLVAEPSPWWLGRLMEEMDLTPILENPRLSLLLGGSPSQVGIYLSKFVCRKVSWLPLRSVATVFGDWLTGVERALDDFQAMTRVNQATLERFGPLWLGNLYRNEQALGKNMSFGPTGIGDLRSVAPGCRVVVAAAGPSLFPLLEVLKKYRERFILIAVDTAWATLRGAGLVADFLVIMDGQYWNARHVDGPVEPPTVVVSELVGHPSTLRLAPGRLFLASSSVPFLRERELRTWGDLGVLKSGGSVATSAWSLALLLGASEVAFAGLDLGYPSGGTHVRGSQFEERSHRLARRTCPAETLGLSWMKEAGLTRKPAVDGRTVVSDPRMDLYRAWLSMSLKENSRVKAWNLSAVGSVIEGLESAGSEVFERWPVQRVPTWTSRPRRMSSDRSLEMLGDLAFPEKIGPDWVDAWEQAGQRLWGTEAWQILGAQAANTWRVFPSPRSERALRAAWKFESILKSQFLRSSKSEVDRS